MIAAIIAGTPTASATTSPASSSPSPTLKPPFDPEATFGTEATLGVAADQLC
jgi:hypothetical protein